MYTPQLLACTQDYGEILDPKQASRLVDMNEVFKLTSYSFIFHDFSKRRLPFVQYELEKLSMSIGNSWESLARRLRFSRMEILLDSIRITRNTKKGVENVGFDQNNVEYHKNSSDATYIACEQALYLGLTRDLLWARAASGERRREDWGGTQERPRNLPK